MGPRGCILAYENVDSRNNLSQEEAVNNVEKRQETALELDGESLPADQHPALVYLAGLSEGSRRTMRGSLDRIAELFAPDEIQADAVSFPWHRLRYSHSQAIRTKLAEEYAPASVNKMLSALRRVLEEAWKLGHMSAEEYQRAADLENIKADTLPKGRRVLRKEMQALREVCEADESPAGLRDLALVALLARAGLRRSEAVGLDVADYRELEDGETAEILVRGKGRKERIVPVNNGAKAVIDAWLSVRGEEEGPLLVPVTKGGEIEIRRMSDQAVYNRAKRRAEQAGLEEFSPHDLRRSYITDLLDAGNDLAVVRDLAGHCSTDTTARYDRRGEEAKRKAAATLSF